MNNTIIQYTEEEMKQMTNIDLLNLINDIKNGSTMTNLSKKIIKHPIVFNELRQRTIFLD